MNDKMPTLHRRAKVGVGICDTCVNGECPYPIISAEIGNGKERLYFKPSNETEEPNSDNLYSVTDCDTYCNSE